MVTLHERLLVASSGATVDLHTRHRSGSWHALSAERGPFGMDLQGDRAVASIERGELEKDGVRLRHDCSNRAEVVTFRLCALPSALCLF
eukprot:scaffold17088_cov127-Isochrysis_galbana.AAC.5